MKTWWNYGFFIFFAIVIPFVPGLLPTIQLNGVYLGGGPVRQFFVNSIASHLPQEVGHKMVNSFMTGDIFDEIILFLPIALNISVITLLFVYCICVALIEGNNYVKSRIYHSQREKAKGA